MPHTPPYLTKEYYPEVGRLMLDLPGYSFSAQIKHTFANYGPAAYLLTAYSAIPVADSIRGFYDELGMKQPVIDYILAPRGKFARLMLRGAEKIRLQNALDESEGKVCIIDEYAVSGNTISRATRTLAEIGIEETVAIKGKWYHNARRKDLDIDQVTSIHSSFMHFIGVQACHQAFSAKS